MTMAIICSIIKYAQKSFGDSCYLKKGNTFFMMRGFFLNIKMKLIALQYGHLIMNKILYTLPIS
jgi:hypothetical protein